MNFLRKTLSLSDRDRTQSDYSDESEHEHDKGNDKDYQTPSPSPSSKRTNTPSPSYTLPKPPQPMESFLTSLANTLNGNFLKDSNGRRRKENRDRSNRSSLTSNNYDSLSPNHIPQQTREDVHTPIPIVSQEYAHARHSTRNNNTKRQQQDFQRQRQSHRNRLLLSSQGQGQGQTSPRQSVPLPPPPPPPPRCQQCHTSTTRLIHVEKERDQLRELLIQKEQQHSSYVDLHHHPKNNNKIDNGIDSIQALTRLGLQMSSINRTHHSTSATLLTTSLKSQSSITLRIAKYALKCKELVEDNVKGKEAIRGLKIVVGRLEEERNFLARKVLIDVAGNGNGAEMERRRSGDAGANEDEENGGKENENNAIIIEMLAVRLEKAIAIIDKLREEKHKSDSVSVSNNNNITHSNASNTINIQTQAKHSASLVKNLSAQLSSERQASRSALRQVEVVTAEFDKREGVLRNRIRELENAAFTEGTRW